MGVIRSQQVTHALCNTTYQVNIHVYIDQGAFLKTDAGFTDEIYESTHIVNKIQQSSFCSKM